MNKSIKIVSILFVFISFFACDSDDDSVQNDVLSARYTYIREAAQGVITFINTSENADSYEWNFGDGTSSIAKNPEKTFTETGEYTVTLTAKNNSTGATNSFSSTVSIEVFQGGLVTNGDFESGTAPWTLGVANPIAPSLLVSENGNTYFSVNVTAAGNPFDVNLSHVGINMTQGRTYRLTFDAWSDVNRSMVAGIGLSGNPWTNQTVVQNITTTSQNYSIDLVANFTNNNSRVIFDLGAAVGRVNIDNVTLNELP
ncbi:carbohydrate binding domain-containing protein [Flavobacterium azooxidireducens]|uniref:Carbohydrate binding domain-containing protein n=1 Tax=Flavobacterium azooxidireducens TaxID=1871076 RepID=A0ABY4KCK7_9FLAO|nr:carbohydrate binding domain-containing protein [Flavobacterium azooxidireducens]UPQ78045.1 carbohydrate binding domain-containing protein [Flavobacterium azooxidireducens]